MTTQEVQFIKDVKNYYFDLNNTDKYEDMIYQITVAEFCDFYTVHLDKYELLFTVKDVVNFVNTFENYLNTNEELQAEFIDCDQLDFTLRDFLTKTDDKTLAKLILEQDTESQTWQDFIKCMFDDLAGDSVYDYANEN